MSRARVKSRGLLNVELNVEGNMSRIIKSIGFCRGCHPPPPGSIAPASWTLVIYKKSRVVFYFYCRG
jgi:hypothetical protein